MMRLPIAVLLAAFVLPACMRSQRYKEEQDYYRSDTSSDARTGSAMARADRFAQPKKRIYVLPFANATPVGGQEFGDFLAQELLRQIRDRRKAVVPENLKVTDTSADFFSGDKVRLTPVVRAGRQLGVSMLIMGRIRKITYRTKGDDVGLFRKKEAIAAVDLEMHLFDVINAKEVLLDERSADSAASHVDMFAGDEGGDVSSQRAELVRMALRSGAELLAKDTGRALSKLGWEGRIAKIVGNQVYINAGRATGLNLGDVLKVMTVGEDVYDPVTGAYMGRARGQPKGTLEVVDYLGSDGAVASVHSGGNFSENDIVQLY